MMTLIQKINRLIQGKPARPYKLFQIESSLDCNLECVMCPWNKLRPSDAIMSWETFARLIPYFELAESVDLTGGGEPLKNPRLVEMVQAAHRAGCEVGFSTNGIRLTGEIAERLVAAGLDWVSFSVDAASADLYESIRFGAKFAMVTGHIAALSKLKRERHMDGPRLMMVMVLMTGEHENYHELPAYIELAHRLGVDQVIAKNLDVIVKEGDDSRRVFSHTQAPSDAIRQTMQTARQKAIDLGVPLRLYSMQPQELTICEHNPLKSIFVNWQGDVSPCITLTYGESRVFDGQRILAPCQKFGNVRQEALVDIWDKPAYQGFRQHYENRLRVERQATLDLVLGGAEQRTFQLPPAPEGCQTCYYLYGV
jgi:MoaA/NifB/PqqE/SkfB family radical SAM enzyme